MTVTVVQYSTVVHANAEPDTYTKAVYRECLKIRAFKDGN